MTGETPTHHHFLLEVCASGTTTRDIPDPDSAIDADDAAQAIAIAQAWADDEGMGALAADLNDVGQRVFDQASGDAHPTDEMVQYQTGVDVARGQFAPGDRVMYDSPMTDDRRRAVVTEVGDDGKVELAAYNSGIEMLSNVSNVPEHRIERPDSAARGVTGWADD